MLDTIPAFEAFARKAGMEGPVRREILWNDLYRGAYPDVFAGLKEVVPEFASGIPAMVRELSRIRVRIKEAAPVMRDIIEEVDPRLAKLMGLAAEPSPLHVLMVGAFTTNSAVGRLGDDVAVFHCLEWYQSVEGSQALVAHEAAHAWHRLRSQQTGQDLPRDEDLAWTIFSEGLATQVSRAAVPGLSEVDYFWYGHPEVDDWVTWCEEHGVELRRRIGDAVDTEGAAEMFFGAGLVEGRWRVGYHVADRVVAGLGRSLPDLVAMSVGEARQAVRDALGG